MSLPYHVKTLILDLDATLIETELTGQINPELEGWDYFRTPSFLVRKRPHLDTFLNYAQLRFKTIYVYTAGERTYANEICAAIFGDVELTNVKLLARDNCQSAKIAGYAEYLKNVQIPPHEGVLVVDDKVYVHAEAALATKLHKNYYEELPGGSTTIYTAEQLKKLIKFGGKSDFFQLNASFFQVPAFTANMADDTSLLTLTKLIAI